MMHQQTLFREPEAVASRNCAECGATFEPYSRAEGYQAYCSGGCRTRAYRARKSNEAGRDALGRLPGAAARDEALEQVQRAEFQEAALGLIRSLVSGEEVTGEEIRLRCEARGIEPHHHNAWGALVMHAVQGGLLSNTGRYVPMTVKRSHARRTPVYVVL